MQLSMSSHTENCHLCSITYTMFIINDQKQMHNFFAHRYHYHCFHLCLNIHYHRILKVHLKFQLLSNKFEISLISNPFLLLEAMLAHKNHAHLQSTILNMSDQFTNNYSQTITR